MNDHSGERVAVTSSLLVAVWWPPLGLMGEIFRNVTGTFEIMRVLLFALYYGQLSPSSLALLQTLRRPSRV